MSITRKKRSIVDLAIKKKHIAGLGDVYIKRPRRVIAYEPPTKEELKKEINKSKYKIVNEPPKEAERYKDVSVEYFVGERVKELTGEIANNLKKLQRLAIEVYEYQEKIDQLTKDIKEANNKIEDFTKKVEEANEQLEKVVEELARKHPQKVGKPYEKVKEQRRKLKEWENKLQNLQTELNLRKRAFSGILQELIKQMEHYNVKTLITDIKKAEGATAEVSQKLELTVKLGAAPTGKIVKKRLERVLSDIRVEIEQRLGKETYGKIADLLDIMDILLKSMGTLIYVTIDAKLGEVEELLAQVQEIAERGQQQEVSASIKLAFSWSALKAKIVGIFNGLIDYLKDAWEKVKTLFHKKEEAEKTLEEYTKRMKQYADELDQILAEAQNG